MEERIEAWSHGKDTVDKETILGMLRKDGGRITKQREALIDIILKEECNCCKELYYLAQKEDPGIGIATIYRTVNALEEIGIIHRKSAYCIRKHDYTKMEKCLVKCEDGSSVELDEEMLMKIIEENMGIVGKGQNKKIKSILIKTAV